MTEMTDDPVSALARRDAALRECLLHLRETLRSGVECVAVLRPSGPDLTTLDDEDRTFLASLIAIIRRVQAIVGHPNDEQPEWLDRIINGDHQ